LQQAGLRLPLGLLVRQVRRRWAKVLVPIERRHTYEDTRRFSEIVAGAIARSYPKLATTQCGSTFGKPGVYLVDPLRGESVFVKALKPRLGGA
jgi:hypothetical protein